MTSPADRGPVAEPPRGGEAGVAREPEAGIRGRSERGLGGRSSPGPGAPGGWAIFAAVVLFIIGSLNALWGLVGILNGDVLTVGGAEVTIWSLTAWGWIHLIVGLLMILTAGGLMAMQDWARWTAVFFAALNAIVQIGVITA